MRVNPVLPVDAILREMIASLGRCPNLVLEAAPGAGKTTRVPPALLGLVTGEVVVLEPRRIAARLAARRVAAEMGEEVGGTVGYQVRFEEVSGPKTRLRFVTEGILTRRLISDPELKGVDAVVLDEFHERHLESDLALALLKRLQVRRPELRIIVMSATLNSGPVAEYLGGCPVLRSEGRMFAVAVRYAGYSGAGLHEQVRVAVTSIANEDSGHVLVFLPGVAEIRRAARECESVARGAGMVVLPLHGELTPAEQDRVVGVSAERKLILATNVAESSVTIEGVTAVVDSGLARIASYSPWTGLPTLGIGRVSKASATQRAGRAGRTGPGRVVRLYSEEDYWLRAEHDAPEIVRSDLSQMALALRVMGVGGFGELEWLDAPPAAAVSGAGQLLDRLGASGVTAKEMARYPLSPRLARVLVEALRRGVGELGCRVAALLGSGARWEKNDLLEAAEGELDGRTLQMEKQLRRLARVSKDTGGDDDSLLMAVLCGFPDRVARLRAGGQVLLSGGGSAEFVGAAPGYEFMVAVDVEDRTEKALPMVRMAARIEPEWLIDLFPERMREEAALTWNKAAERVDAVETLLYDELVVQESRDAVPDAEGAAALLAARVEEVGVGRFVEEAVLADLRARVSFAGLEQPDMGAALTAWCLGRRGFGELKGAGAELLALLEGQVDGRRLREGAPVSLKLKAGRMVKVNYEMGKPPWIGSRLQDFFGMTETPRIGPERVPVVVHLLAPNHRAVQMTSDLGGFWERLYPTVRRELMRRYPRHLWPERP